MNRVVIAGAGLAGLRAAQTLRESAFDGEIVFVGEEAHWPYNRPPLSKGLLTGNAVETALPISSDLDASWRLGVSAAALNIRERQLSLSDGDALGYDGLVIATGSRARKPAFSGATLPGIHVLRTLEDATRLAAALKRANDIVIVGAGVVGCEVASSAISLGKSVTLIDTAGVPMERVLGTELGKLAAHWHALNGVRLELNTAVEHIQPQSTGMTVFLADNKTLACDLVVLATGGVPNCEWLESSGLTIENGVRCDARCFAIAGQERIVAAGDVARWDHNDFQAPIRVEHWTNAAEQGAAAATALLDPSSAPPFRPLLSFWTDQYGQRLQSIGAPWLGRAITFVKGSSHDPKFVALAILEGQVMGAVSLNMPAGLIEWRSRIGSRHE